MKNTDLKAIGLMSGTSCDGLDIAYCHFMQREGGWTYTLLAAETIAYTDALLAKLRSAPQLSAKELLSLDREFGTFCGREVLGFLDRYALTPPHVLGSHGHTVFHVPQEGLTYQMGSGASLHAACAIPVVCDFRSVDVALGGQGAPLVPIGDRMLYPEYDYCLNLGGIANISYEASDKRVAFDICPVNMVLNLLAQELGHTYDKDGLAAASGSVNEELLNALNNLSFYKGSAPKSLGKEWFDEHFLPVLQSFSRLSIHDLLASCVEHIATQIALVVKKSTGSKQRMLVTGGGAFNKYLIKVLEDKLKGQCVVEVPDEATVGFKEAIVFALLATLRYTGQVNVLSESTGSSRSHSGGALYGI